MSLRWLLLAPILALLSAGASAGTWYVRRNAGPGGDGLSWATALQRVQDAQALAQTGDAIWVAFGTYRPGSFGSPRSSTFTLANGVALYGGFAGNETSLSQRDIDANPTFLSGDLHLDDRPGFLNRSDNCYHVISAAGVGPGTVLDGFTIRGGNADGTGNDANGGGLRVASTTSPGPTFAHLRFVDNSAGFDGGGAAVYGHLVLADSLFEDNRAGEGGGLFVNNASVDVVRCVLRSNDVTGYGGACALGDFGSANLSNCLLTGNSAFYAGAFHLTYGYGVLRNCTVAANHATAFGGLAFNGFGYTDVYNSILWGNTDTTHPGLYEQQLNDGNTYLSYCAIQGSSAPWNQDPRWVDPLGADGIGGTADDDLRLSCLSPYIDAGSNAGVGGGALDLSGGPRFLDDLAVPDTGTGTAPIVDLGPYEFDCSTCGGSVQGYCNALPNSTGAPAAIAWSGSTSLFANSFTLHASSAPPLKSGLFFYGPTQLSVPWGDGIRCVGGWLQRLSVLQTDATGSASFHLDFTLPPASMGPHAILPGSLCNFQFIFRDPAGGPAGWNATDALGASFCP